MKKYTKLGLLCICLCFCFLMTGCHGAKSQNAFEIPDSFDSSRQYDVTFWAKNDTNITQVKIYEKAIADFEQLYPNIHVNLRLYTDYKKIYNDVITNIQTGTTPNVCITYPDHIATYLTGNNVVVPLDGLFEDAQYGFGGSLLNYDSPEQSELVPQFLEECSLGEHYYAIPFMRSTEALYVNMDYVEKLGFDLPETVTWDFIWEVSEAAMEKNPDGTYKINGQNTMIPFIYKSTDNMMISMLRQLNAGYSDDAGNILLFNDTTKKLLTDLADEVKKSTFSTFKISGYPSNFLNAGQNIFTIDSTAGATWVGTDAPLLDISEDRLVRFRTEVRPIPQFDPEHPKMISQGPSLCVFNKEDPQEVLASWIFAQYLLTNEVQISYSKTEGYVPVTLKAQQSKEYRDYMSRCGEDNEEHYDVKIKAANLLIDNTENTFVTPVFNGSASLRDAAGQLIENVTKSVRRGETIDNLYMEELFGDITSLFRLDRIGNRNGASTEKNEELGPLPDLAISLLVGLVIAWVLICAVFLSRIIRKKRTVQGTDK